jgi:hypothetical protein
VSNYSIVQYPMDSIKTRMQVYVLSPSAGMVACSEPVDIKTAKHSH